MQSQGTGLLSRDKTDETREGYRPRLGPGKARLAFLLTLLALGAFGSFILASRYASYPDENPANEPAGRGAGQPAAADARPRAAGHAAHERPASEAHAVTPGTVEGEWGVRVTRLALTADGALVDLRYEVTDPEKASEVLDPDQQVYLLDEKSDKAVSTARFPKIGDLRPQTGEFEDGTVYFMGFNNPDGMFEPGDLVTLAVGPRRLEHVPIR